MMKCPVCSDVRMREIEKDGVLIDVCPDCKGVWLDRGELDKLMSEVREVRQDFNDWHQGRDRDRDRQPPSYPDSRYDNRPDNRYDNRQYDPKYGSPYGKHRKKSVLDRLGDLFD